MDPHPPDATATFRSLIAQLSRRFDTRDQQVLCDALKADGPKLPAALPDRLEADEAPDPQATY